MVCWNWHTSFTPAERIIKRSGRSCLEIVCTAQPMVYIRSVCVCVFVCVWRGGELSVDQSVLLLSTYLYDRCSKVI